MLAWKSCITFNFGKRFRSGRWATHSQPPQRGRYLSFNGAEIWSHHGIENDFNENRTDADMVGVIEN